MITNINFHYVRYFMTPNKQGWKKVARDNDGNDVGSVSEADSTLIEALISYITTCSLVYSSLGHIIKEYPVAYTESKLGGL